MFLLEDGEEPVVIATQRSLRRAGYSVTVGASVPRTMSSCRDVDRRYGIPSSEDDRASQARDIATLTNDVTYVAVLPPMRRALSASRSRDLSLPSLAGAIPEFDLVSSSTSKLQLEGVAKGTSACQRRSRSCVPRRHPGRRPVAPTSIAGAAG